MNAQSLSAASVVAPTTDARRVFTRQAISLLGFTLLVVLFGAIVRITGSGAGCGKHWPTCQGEIVHLPRRLETLIELSHRISTGLNAVLVFLLTFRATRVFAKGHPVRRALGVASAMMVVESLIGALLVLMALVGTDASLRRAVVMPLHLIATSILGAALALGAFHSLPPATASPRSPSRRSVSFAGIAVLLVSATGAVTALGDTIYPVQAAPFAARLLHDQASTAHFLERLRVVHPLLAIAGAVSVIAAAANVLGEATSALSRSLAKLTIALVLAQVGLGVLNVLLSAPGWMQVVHLFVANLVWLALVALWAELAHARQPPLGVFGPRTVEN